MFNDNYASQCYPLHYIYAHPESYGFESFFSKTFFSDTKKYCDSYEIV